MEIRKLMLEYTPEQVTYKQLQGDNEWIRKNRVNDDILKMLEYEMRREDFSKKFFDYHGISVFFDYNCQDATSRYHIFRADGNVYETWEAKTPLKSVVFKPVNKELYCLTEDEKFLTFSAHQVFAAQASDINQETLLELVESIRHRPRAGKELETIAILNTTDSEILIYDIVKRISSDGASYDTFSFVDNVRSFSYDRRDYLDNGVWLLHDSFMGEIIEVWYEGDLQTPSCVTVRILGGSLEEISATLAIEAQFMSPRRFEDMIKVCFDKNQWN